MDAAAVSSVVDRIEGFSGREISKLAIAWQAAAYGRPDATIDAALMEDVLKQQLAAKSLKTQWAQAEFASYAAITNTGPTAVPSHLPGSALSDPSAKAELEAATDSSDLPPFRDFRK